MAEAHLKSFETNIFEILEILSKFLYYLLIFPRKVKRSYSIEGPTLKLKTSRLRQVVASSPNSNYF